jgi:glutamine synthetase
MQTYVPKTLVMMAPYVNSYRRLTPDMSAPVNNAWGYDNRTTAFRVPVSDAGARRVENRLPAPMPTLTWRWQPRSPAACSAS